MDNIEKSSKSSVKETSTKNEITKKVEEENGGEKEKKGRGRNPATSPNKTIEKSKPVKRPSGGGKGF